MKLLCVSKNPNGLRVHILGARIHHGLAGAFMVCWGAFLMAKDLDDFPWWHDR